EQRGGRDQHAVPCAHEPTGQVRDHQPHETDRPGPGDRRRGAQRDQQQEADPGPVRGDAEAVRDLVTGAERIEPPGAGEHEDGAQDRGEHGDERNAFHRAREREPSIQNITERDPSAESDEKISRFVTAVSAYPTATPDSSSRREVTRPPARAMRKTISAAPRAPRKASTDCAYSPS